jgi:glycosyltransferase involved in cell wall biosynthesis
LAVVQRPQVTVVIPTRNRWELLSRHGLPSALGQEEVEVEVVVVDDGGTDGTAEQVAALPDVRVRLVRHEQSRGIGHGRNSGLAEATGEWVAFLDDDDLWSPRKLRAQLDVAAARDAVWAYTTMLVLDEQTRVIETLPAPDPAEIGTLLRVRNALPAGGSTVIARSDVARRLGGFDTELNELADWDFWLRLDGAGPAASAPEPLVGYFRHSRQMRLTEAQDVEHEFRHLEAKHGLGGMDLYFSRWVAMGHLRAGRRARAAREYLRGGLAHRNLGNVVRAGAALVGERAFGLRRRVVADRAEPEWLERYR